MSQNSQSISKKPLIAYFALTFLITWTCWIISILLMGQNGYAIPSIYNAVDLLENGYTNAEHQALAFLFLCGTWGPMFAAIIVIGARDGKAGLVDLMKRVFNFRFAWYWYPIIIAVPLIGVIFMVGASGLAGNDLSGIFRFNTSAWFIVVVFLNQIVTSGLEEPGWRGFATPEFQKFRNAEDSGFYIGMIWGIWHFPFIIYLNLSMGNSNAYLIGLQLFGYVMLMAPMGIITVWMYNNTRSVGLLILSHAVNNFIPFLFGNNIIDVSGGFIIAITSWVIAILLTKKYGKETLLISRCIDA